MKKLCRLIILSFLEKATTKKYITPKIGITFDLKNYVNPYQNNMYVGYVKFNTRKDWLNKSKIDYILQILL